MTQRTYSKQIDTWTPDESVQPIRLWANFYPNIKNNEGDLKQYPDSDHKNTSLNTHFWAQCEHGLNAGKNSLNTEIISDSIWNKIVAYRINDLTFLHTVQPKKHLPWPCACLEKTWTICLSAVWHMSCSTSFQHYDTDKPITEPQLCQKFSMYHTLCFQKDCYNDADATGDCCNHAYATHNPMSLLGYLT